MISVKGLRVFFSTCLAVGMLETSSKKVSFNFGEIPFFLEGCWELEYSFLPCVGKLLFLFDNGRSYFDTWVEDYLWQ